MRDTSKNELKSCMIMDIERIKVHKPRIQAKKDPE
jgi:hypothetical protein